MLLLIEQNNVPNDSKTKKNIIQYLESCPTRKVIHVSEFEEVLGLPRNNIIRELKQLVDEVSFVTKFHPSTGWLYLEGEKKSRKKIVAAVVVVEVVVFVLFCMTYWIPVQPRIHSSELELLRSFQFSLFFIWATGLLAGLVLLFKPFFTQKNTEKTVAAGVIMLAIQGPRGR